MRPRASTQRAVAAFSGTYAARRGRHGAPATRARSSLPASRMASEPIRRSCGNVQKTVSRSGAKLTAGSRPTVAGARASARSKLRTPSPGWNERAERRCVRPATRTRRTRPSPRPTRYLTRTSSTRSAPSRAARRRSSRSSSRWGTNGSGARADSRGHWPTSLRSSVASLPSSAQATVSPRARALDLDGDARAVPPGRPQPRRSGARWGRRNDGQQRCVGRTFGHGADDRRGLLDSVLRRVPPVLEPDLDVRREDQREPRRPHEGTVLARASARRGPARRARGASAGRSGGGAERSGGPRTIQYWPATNSTRRRWRAS